MFRNVVVCVVVLVAVRLVPVAAAIPPGEVRVGGSHEGEIGENQISVSPLQGGNGIRNFGVEIPITLKAGQTITVSVMVVGQGREALLALLDPSGKTVSVTSWRKKTIDLTVEEVSANGKYKIVVLSDRIGAF